MSRNNRVLIRGGGDLATGVAVRLHRAGIRVVIVELAQPLAVRRTVSFAEAVFDGVVEVEGIRARLIEAKQLSAWDDADEIPVLIDPNADILSTFHFPVVVDARLTKQPPSPISQDIPLHIGLGPGFHAGRNCHAVIETNRSHTLGRVIWDGTAQPDSGEPEGNPRRVLRAPADGTVISKASIGDHLEEGQVIAEIQSEVGDRKSQILSPFKGVLRGLIRDGLEVPKGLKIGDVDPRDDARLCYLVSDKALAIGGGALEAILSKREIRDSLYGTDHTS
ncbi:MAG TPA: selenium-dependent molybdenum cofactor biosynthesis protein YqeB [Anaerolineales bacterium]|nr:selenium-dependent molybdenum cofactor biosynthesis protein YqeB [Anaerolineales bacterium]